MNYHVMPHLPRIVSNTFKLNISFSSFTADMYVDALSDIMVWGKDLQLTNRRKASMNVTIVRSVTTSRRMALVVAHVNIQ